MRALGGIWLEEEVVAIKAGIFGEMVQGVLEAGWKVVEAFLESQQDGHEDSAGSSAGILSLFLNPLITSPHI